MDPKGDIPDAEDVEPPSDGKLSPTALAKVAMVEEILNSGGVAHVYLESVTVPQGEAEDFHLHSYNTHCYPETGWIYVHGDDRDRWMPGSDIGLVERHYD